MHWTSCYFLQRLFNISLIPFVLSGLLKSLFSFNDRIRDATLGGSPFGHPLQQGFITGLLLQVFWL